MGTIVALEAFRRAPDAGARLHRRRRPERPVSRRASAHRGARAGDQAERPERARRDSRIRQPVTGDADRARPGLAALFARLFETQSPEGYLATAEALGAMDGTTTASARRRPLPRGHRRARSLRAARRRARVRHHPSARHGRRSDPRRRTPPVPRAASGIRRRRSQLPERSAVGRTLVRPDRPDQSRPAAVRSLTAVTLSLQRARRLAFSQEARDDRRSVWPAREIWRHDVRLRQSRPCLRVRLCATGLGTPDHRRRSRRRGSAARRSVRVRVAALQPRQRGIPALARPASRSAARLSRAARPQHQHPRRGVRRRAARRAERRHFFRLRSVQRVHGDALRRSPDAGEREDDAAEVSGSLARGGEGRRAVPIAVHPARPSASRPGRSAGPHRPRRDAAGGCDRRRSDAAPRIGASPQAGRAATDARSAAASARAGAGGAVSTAEPAAGVGQQRRCGRAAPVGRGVVGRRR